MSTFYDKIGNKTIAELPAVPTSFDGVYAASATTFTWVNNNIITGCTNVVQYYTSNAWTDLATVASNIDTYVFTGDTISAAGTYNVRVAAYETGTTRYYPSLVDSVYLWKAAAVYPTVGLLGRWTLESDLTDSSGNGRDLTATEMTYNFVTGVGGVDGLQYGNTGTEYGGLYSNDAAFQVFYQQNPWTISCWFKFTSVTSRFQVMSYGSSIADASSYLNPDSGAIYIIGRNGWQQWGFQPSGFDDGNWHHHVITYDGLNLRYYFDAAIQMNEEENWEQEYKDGFWLTNYNESQTQQEVQYGYVYDNALNQTDITTLYNGGAGV